MRFVGILAKLVTKNVCSQFVRILRLSENNNNIEVAELLEEAGKLNFEFALI
jgi:hypothetical protein